MASIVSQIVVVLVNRKLSDGSVKWQKEAGGVTYHNIQKYEVSKFRLRKEMQVNKELKNPLSFV